jgi:hypothetical protein
MTEKQATELLNAIHDVMEWASMRGPVGSDWRKFARLERAVKPLTKQVNQPVSRPLIEVIE